MSFKKRFLIILLTLLLSIVPMTSISANAIECTENIRSTCSIVSTLPTSVDNCTYRSASSFYESVGDFSTYMLDTLTIPYSSTVSVYLFLKYPDIANETVTFEIYDSRGNHYIDKIVAVPSSNTWSIYIPAGTYTILLVSGNNHLTYGLMVSPV